jgi:hypothetical protein
MMPIGWGANEKKFTVQPLQPYTVANEHHSSLETGVAKKK